MQNQKLLDAYPSRQVTPAMILSTQRAAPGCLEPLKLTYVAGEILYAEGDPKQSLYRITSGAVRTVKHTIDGRRQVGDFYLRDDVVGIDEGYDHSFSAEALCRTEVAVYRLASQSVAMNEDQFVVAAMMAELCRMQMHMAILARKCATEKVAGLLLYLSQRSRAVPTHLAMSREDMADFLGLAHETVSRVLGQLQIDGLVVFKTCRDFYIVRDAALKRAAGL